MNGAKLAEANLTLSIHSGGEWVRGGVERGVTGSAGSRAPFILREPLSAVVGVDGG